jgi:hypothetical protein
MLRAAMMESLWTHQDRILRWIETTECVLELSVAWSSETIITVGADLFAKLLVMAVHCKDC